MNPVKYPLRARRKHVASRFGISIKSLSLQAENRHPESAKMQKSHGRVLILDDMAFRHFKGDSIEIRDCGRFPETRKRASPFTETTCLQTSPPPTHIVLAPHFRTYIGLHSVQAQHAGMRHGKQRSFPWAAKTMLSRTEALSKRRAVPYRSCFPVGLWGQPLP